MKTDGRRRHLRRRRRRFQTFSNKIIHLQVKRITQQKLVGGIGSSRRNIEFGDGNLVQNKSWI